MKTLLLCAALMSGAAGAFEIEPGQSLPNTVTYVCPPDLQPVLFRMFAEWNAVVDGRFTLVEADQNDLLPTLRILEVPSIADGAYIGYTYMFPLHAEIHIAPCNATLTDNVMLHELGHALGLAHSDKTAVMYPVISAVTMILTADDVAGVRAIYRLPPADFAFKIIAKRGKRRVMQFSISGSAINNDWVTWDFGDGTQVYGSVMGSSFAHWYPRGRYTVTATYLGCTETLQVRVR